MWITIEYSLVYPLIDGKYFDLPVPPAQDGPLEREQLQARRARYGRLSAQLPLVGPGTAVAYVAATVLRHHDRVHRDRKGLFSRSTR